MLCLAESLPLPKSAFGMLLNIPLLIDQVCSSMHISCFMLHACDMQRASTLFLPPPPGALAHTAMAQDCYCHSYSPPTATFMITPPLTSRPLSGVRGD
jgi:hypothetical protein